VNKLFIGVLVVCCLVQPELWLVWLGVTVVGWVLL